MTRVGVSSQFTAHWPPSTLVLVRLSWLAYVSVGALVMIDANGLNGSDTPKGTLLRLQTLLSYSTGSKRACCWSMVVLTMAAS